jgi:hypothetical protein
MNPDKLQKGMLREYALNMVAFPPQPGVEISQEDEKLWELMHQSDFSQVKVLNGQEVKVEDWVNAVRSFYHFTSDDIEMHQDTRTRGERIPTPKLAIANPAQIRAEAMGSTVESRNSASRERLGNFIRDSANVPSFGNLIHDEQSNGTASYKRDYWDDIEAKEAKKARKQEIINKVVSASVTCLHGAGEQVKRGLAFVKACVHQNTWSPDCNNVTTKGVDTTSEAG